VFGEVFENLYGVLDIFMLPAEVFKIVKNSSDDLHPHF
jgi:hypothetical protein